MANNKLEKVKFLLYALMKRGAYLCLVFKDEFQDVGPAWTTVSIYVPYLWVPRGIWKSL